MTVELSDLNTRDKLLLVQLAEQHGVDNYDEIHENFHDHPVFKLSHNRLHGTQLELTFEDTKALIDEILSQHSDLSIVSVCETYYDARMKELEAEIQENKELFNSVKTKI